MTDRGWTRRFHTPIALPGGRTLATLRDAGGYIASLPPKESALPHWQTAARELMMSAERGGILLLAEWAMKAAIHHGKAQPMRSRRRTPAKRYTIIR